MRFSIISVVFLLLLSSCGIPTIKGLAAYKPKTSEFVNPYFANTTIDYVYKAKINAYNNDFGGILIIKKIKDNNHRIVFTTNFGNKIFDFELVNNKVKIHFIMKELDRKVIIKTLTQDFKTLTQEHNKIYKAFKKSGSVLIYQSKMENRYNHYLVNNQPQILTSIVNTTKSKEKVIFSFSNIKISVAKSISIEHKTSPIHIDLVYLNN